MHVNLSKVYKLKRQAEAGRARRRTHGYHGGALSRSGVSRVSLIVVPLCMGPGPARGPGPGWGPMSVSNNI